jgi:2-polyprenyl-3-methyl-5-hydroxy-6-metoxy-1,4-benzoquinol methylase
LAGSANERRPSATRATLERLDPDTLDVQGATGRETLRLHLERYEFAAGLASTGRLLDIACGVGYGTRLVTDRCPELDEGLGIDRSEEAIAHARATYANARTRYRSGDAMTFADEAGFDVIVSLETLEHLPRPDAFLARLAPMLRPGGVLVASVPTTPSVDFNPHHLHDFTERSLRRLVAPLGLEEVAALRQVQKVPVLSVLRRRESRMADMRRSLPRYYLTHPGAFARRLLSTLCFGFTNRYATIAWRRIGPDPQAISS